MNYAGLSSHEGFLPSFPAAFLCFPFHILTSLSLPLIFKPISNLCRSKIMSPYPKEKNHPPIVFPYPPTFPPLVHSLTHLDVTHNSLFQHLSKFFCCLYSHGKSAEQRRGSRPVPRVSDSHKCVKEEKRKSFGLLSFSQLKLPD